MQVAASGSKTAAMVALSELKRSGSSTPVALATRNQRQRRGDDSMSSASSASSSPKPIIGLDLIRNAANVCNNKSANKKKLFPQKLWDLINDRRYNFCLRWSDDGQLVYLNRDQFEEAYLRSSENQFHTQKSISFVRQMNMYGFRKVDDCYYENDNFKRNCQHLLKNMVRKHPKRNHVTSTGTVAEPFVDTNEISNTTQGTHDLNIKTPPLFNRLNYVSNRQQVGHAEQFLIQQEQQETELVERDLFCHQRANNGLDNQINDDRSSNGRLTATTSLNEKNLPVGQLRICENVSAFIGNQNKYAHVNAADGRRSVEDSMTSLSDLSFSNNRVNPLENPIERTEPSISTMNRMLNNFNLQHLNNVQSKQQYILIAQIVMNILNAYGNPPPNEISATEADEMSDHTPEDNVVHPQTIRANSGPLNLSQQTNLYGQALSQINFENSASLYHDQHELIRALIAQQINASSNQGDCSITNSIQSFQDN